MFWYPKSTEELERAVNAKSVEETPSLEFKRQLPSRPADNWKVAKEVAGLSVGGGTLIYGVEEDENKRPTKLVPFDLTDQDERVEQIVRSSIAEPPQIETKLLWRTNQDGGYLVVAIPASARAPHQVIAGKEYRYYGRSGTLTVPLSETQIAGLYQQRAEWAEARDEYLIRAAEELTGAPFMMISGPYLCVAIRPLGPVSVETETLEEPLNQMIKSVATEAGGSEIYFFPVSRERRSFGRRVEMSIEASEQHLDVTYSGEVRLLTDAAFDDRGDGRAILPGQIGIRVRQTLALAGKVLDKTDFWGSVDVGFALIGGEGSILRQSIYHDAVIFHDRCYIETDRILSSRLVADHEKVARQLTERLFHTLHVTDAGNPFKRDEA